MDGKTIGVLAIAALALVATSAYAAVEQTPAASTNDNTGGDVDSNVLALLALVKQLESNGDYTVLVGGGHFTDFSDHPGNLGWKGIPTRDGLNVTTAAGAYQITKRTFNTYKNQFGVATFDPQAQDRFALGLLRVRGALPLIQAGNFAGALAKLPDEWESIRFVLAGQYHIDLAQAEQIYTDNGGVLA